MLILSLCLQWKAHYSTAIDVVEHAANIVRNKQDGLTAGLSPSTVHEKIARDDDFILLDVRTDEEYEQERIGGPRVKLLPLGNLRERLGELPKDKEIVTYCKISLRGYEAQRILAGQGFTDVKTLDGGLVAWPYEKVSGEQG
ncbi:MAG: rhodanese-like domain-containing protein [Dehalococcoidales bacterium]|nr:rhodanese-like domain-containing protein [Dehalococcoidales bacterium]